jgi:hypothetical protein
MAEQAADRGAKDVKDFQFSVWCAGVDRRRNGAVKLGRARLRCQPQGCVRLFMQQIDCNVGHKVDP